MEYGKILIAEDEEGLRDALKLFLEGKGFEVDTVPDGERALEELEKGGYDLLLTDMKMPNRTGAELIDIIARWDKSKRPEIIVMTAYGTVDSAIDAINVGISSFLRKPLKMTELEAAVATAAERRLMEKELRRYYTELDHLVEERTRQLSLLNRFSEIVNRSLDLEEILEGAVEHMSGSMEADVAWIYLEEGDPPVLKLKASRGLSDWFMSSVSTLEDMSAIRYDDLRGGRSVTADLATKSGEITKLAVKDGLKTAMVSPIRSGEKVMGVLGVASRTGYEFNQSDIETLSSMGNQIGVSVDRIRLFEEGRRARSDLRDKVDQLVVLNEMGNLVRVSRHFDDAAKAVVSAVAQSLGFDRVCLWTMEEEGGKLRLAASFGMEETAEDGLVVGVDPDWLNRCIPDDEYSASECEPVCGMIGYEEVWGGAPPRNLAMVPLVTRSAESFDKNCWEYFGCEDKGCSAYMNPLACWMVQDSCKRKQPAGTTLLDKLDVCKACDVYKFNHRGRNIGILCVDRGKKAGRMSTDDVKALNVYANSAAAALENIRLMEQLIKDERFIDGIIFNMSSGLLVTDSEGLVRMVNFAGAEILHTEVDALVGRMVSKVFPELEAVLEVEESPVGHEVGVMTPGGPVPVGYTNSYLTDSEGGVEGVIVVFRDLSDIKVLHEQLRNKDRFAAIGKVAAGVAHEIRNPLFGITSVAQILGREINEDTPQKGLIDAMLAETSRLNTLVEELLMYGRPTKLAPQPVDIRELLLSVLEFYDQMIKDKGVTVKTDFADADVEINADPHQIRQVFLNLLVNALDSLEPGGTVEVKTATGDTMAEVKISDNGIGMQEEDLAKVFDLFYTTKEKGTGLGLPICRKIIEDHGGSVSISSRPGAGTTVSLILPMMG